MHRSTITPLCILMALFIMPQTGCKTVVTDAYTARDFGRKIAASYLVEFSERTHGGLLAGEAIVTFGADGTFASEETLDFGADHPPRFKSGKRGTWTQTGPRELTLTFLAFDYGQEQQNPVPDHGPENRVTGTVRVISTVLFAEDFQAFSWEGAVEVFLAIDGADPLDPDAVPSIGPFPASATGRRIPAPFGIRNLPEKPKKALTFTRAPNWSVVFVAHRGGMVDGVPENTLAAFRHAIGAGADAIEIDLRGTVDGHVPRSRLTHSPARYLQPGTDPRSESDLLAPSRQDRSNPLRSRRGLVSV